MLSRKQRVFIEEYLSTWNATQAALAAGYSKRTAGAIGYENLKKPEIAKEIQRRIDDKAMKADEILLRLAEIARGDMTQILNENDEISLRAAIKNGAMKNVKSITPLKHGGYRVEFYSAVEALELLGKHHKLFTDRTEVTLDGPPVMIYVPDNGRNTPIE